MATAFHAEVHDSISSEELGWFLDAYYSARAAADAGECTDYSIAWLPPENGAPGVLAVFRIGERG